MIKYTYNFNSLLVNLKKVTLAVLLMKSKFYDACIKVLRFFCDLNSHDSNLSSVFKIFDLLKCVYITATQNFIDIFVYYKIRQKSFFQIVALIYKFYKTNTQHKWEKKKKVMILLELLLTSFSTLGYFNYTLEYNHKIWWLM